MICRQTYRIFLTRYWVNWILGNRLTNRLTNWLRRIISQRIATARLYSDGTMSIFLIGTIWWTGISILVHNTSWLSASGRQTRLLTSIIGDVDRIIAAAHTHLTGSIKILIYGHPYQPTLINMNTLTLYRQS